MYGALVPAPAARGRADRRSSSSTPSATTRAETLSGGQRGASTSRSAWSATPSVLFLDEPTTGFDPARAAQAWSTIRALCSLGKTVVLDHPLHGRGAGAGRPRRRDGRRARSSPSARPRSSAAATRCRPRSASRCPRRDASRPAASCPPASRRAGRRERARRDARAASPPPTAHRLGAGARPSRCAASPSPSRRLEDVYLASAGATHDRRALARLDSPGRSATSSARSGATARARSSGSCSR